MGYWIKIALGALGVFAIGMFAVSMFRTGTDRVQDVLAEMPRVMASIPEHLDPLRIGGSEAGSVNRVHLVRTMEGDRSMEITLAPNDSGLALLAACPALVGPIDSIFEGGLRCAVADSFLDHEEYGALIVEGREATLPLYATAADVEEFRGDANHTPAEVDIRADSAGETNVTVIDENGRERVRVIADSSGAKIEIRDSDGHHVFSLDADSMGLRFNARDTN